MPRFHLDTSDSDISIRDPEGHDLADREAARRLALDTLADMARDRLPDGDRRDFACNVRDEAGTPIFTATLTLIGRWLD